MNENKRLSQIDAQILNRFLADQYGLRLGWVRIYGWKNIPEVARQVKKKFGVEVSVTDMIKELE